MTASSPTEFYLIEFFKVAVPVCGIALVLIAATRRYRVVRTQSSLWLVTITALWLLITLADRLAFSVPARHYFISATMNQYAAHRESSYFAITGWLWTAEQTIILAFGVSLFFAFRGELRQRI